MEDIIAYGQMRGKVNCDLELKKYNPWSKRMTDLDKVLGQLKLLCSVLLGGC